MIDYFAHVSTLQACLKSLTNAPPPDPAHSQAVTQALQDANSEPGAAALGTLMDQLLQFSQAKTAAELKILSKAASLYQTALDLYNQVGVVRTSMEAGMTTPSAPGVLDAYNAALAALPAIGAGFQALSTELTNFQAADSGNWMIAVGQQADQPVHQWAWRDIFLARRTTAFVTNANSLATTNKQKAFALGTLAGAAGNFLGSSYLNSVVGGPRRSHQIRHRLAAYAVGAWFRDNESQFAGSLAGLQTALEFGETAPTSLPTELKSLIHDALHETYPHGVPAIPDVDTGYKNILTHLSLLQEFSVPTVSPALNNALTQQILGIGLVPGTVTIQSGGTSGGGGGGGAGGNTDNTGLGGNFPGIGAHEDAGAVCATILLWIVTVGLIVAGYASSGSNYPGKPGTSTGTGGQGPAPGINESVTLPQLEAISQTPDGLSTINSVYGMQLSLWQALAASRLALVLRGLLYPESSDLASPTFAQFLTKPISSAVAQETPYPQLAMPAYDDGTTYPNSGLEAPATVSSPYVPLASPSSFLTIHPVFSIYALSPKAWVDMVETGPKSQVENLDLDADRGFWAPCWTLAPGGSITNPPLDIVKLGYTEI